MTDEPLSLAHLTTFIGVVEAGGFARAGRARHVSQSTVSHHIRSLELRLGVTLFDRVQGPATLTAHGERLFRGARQLLSTHDDLVGEFTAVTKPTISIGSTEHAGDHLLPRLIAALRATYPGHEIRFTFDRSTALNAAVARGTLDLALTLATSDQAPGTPLGALDLRWVAAPGWSTALATVPTPLPLIVFDNPCGIRERAQELLRTSGIDTYIAAQSTSLDGIVAAVRSGLGLALLPIAQRIPDDLVEIGHLPDAGGVEVHLVAADTFDDASVSVARDAVRELLVSLRVHDGDATRPLAIGAS